MDGQCLQTIESGPTSPSKSFFTSPGGIVVIVVVVLCVVFGLCAVLRYHKKRKQKIIEERDGISIDLSDPERLI